MNKKYLLPLVALTILACNFLFSRPSATSEVSDGSPTEENLQPQDVPGLTETADNLPAEITNPIDCVQLNLTSEECANAGVHTYSLSKQLYPSCKKVFADWDPGSKLTITLTFSDNTLDIFPLVTGSKDHEIFTRDKPNQFSQESDTYDDSQHLHHKYLITFTKTGFKVHYAYLSAIHPYRDCWELTYEIQK